MTKRLILDYGCGNLGSVQNALTHLGYPATISPSPEDIDSCELLIMPGQGSFGTAMSYLRDRQLVSPILNHIKQNKPFLGICVGFQLLFEGSDEKGSHDGLGIFPGRFSPFIPSDLSVPHMGWNTLHIQHDPLQLASQLSDQSHVYFVHSYYLDQTDPSIIFATCDYGVPFVAAIQTESLLATQFHPEKSGDVGLDLLNRFLRTF